MDYLMWLALMQELDDAPALPELLDPDKRVQKRQSLQSAAAAKALEAAWEQTSSAVRTMEKHASAETGKNDARQREHFAASALFSQSGGHFAFGEDAPSGEKADMEEISRFFERDARRF